MNAFDLTVLHWFNSLAGQNDNFDLAVAAFTNYAPLLFLLLFLIFFVSRRGQADRMRRVVILAGLSGVLAMGVVILIGVIYYRPRPFTLLPPEQLFILIAHKPDPSFPSDHATGAAAFAAGMWRAPSPAARWIFTVTAVLVGLSRLVVGVHWPTDVLASFLLGALCAKVLFALERPLTPLLDFALSLFDKVSPRGQRKGER